MPSQKGTFGGNLAASIALTDAYGVRLFHIPAAVAEMERESIVERTIAGLAAARKNGGIGHGRKSALTPDKVDTARKLLGAGDKPVKVARVLQVGLSTFKVISRRVSGRTTRMKDDVTSDSAC